MNIDIFGALFNNIKPSLSTVLFVAVVFIGFSLFVRKWEKLFGEARGKRPWPFRQRALLTDIETKMFLRLREAFPDALVFSQVALNRIVEFPADNKWLYKTGGKSVDFVICHAAALEVFFVVELDDSSHARRDRWQADEIKTAILEDARIPLFRWNVRRMPTIAEIRNIVDKRFPSVYFVQ